MSEEYQWGIKEMDLGKWGENRAAAYLDSLGWSLMERNFRCRFGELDIVALDGNCLVFVEVKTRRTLGLGPPCISITAQKQRRLLQTARYYCSVTRAGDAPMRMDVIEILKCGAKVWLRHTENAFGE